MKNFVKHITVVTVITFTFMISCTESKPEVKAELGYDDYPVYSASDLGVKYSSDKTVFKLWSPAAEKVVLRIYDKGLGGEEVNKISLKKVDKGVWEAELNEDIKNKYYSFQVKVDGKWNSEEVDPYAKVVGVNGKRGMVVDMSETNPKGWEEDLKPELKGIEDIILYEIQIRDISISSNSGIKNKGKFVGLTEFGTVNNEELSTGIDHIKEMGVTHVHILPAFDFRSIDETKPELNKYNWGYDPQNYNVPEGSYSTDPYDGKVRVREFKEMVQAFHKAGIRVVLDVVYNHTGFTNESNFDQLVPGYYYRQWDDGKYADASACGNETASDREMMRKFIVESVVYWAKEYHLDGFRFDLMGIHDVTTMNDLDKAVKEVDPSIFVYGEGWTAGDSPLPISERAIKDNGFKLNTIAIFSDDIRDGIKGSWSAHDSKGYVSGNLENREDVKFGIVASTQHPDLDYSKVSYSKKPWSKSPLQTINYVSCHDNHTLYDKLKISNPNTSDIELLQLSKLANTIILTSQGIPFLHAGVEMGRTKYGVENSYQSPDSINEMDWSLKTKNIKLVDYYEGLIKLRMNHPAFKMKTAKLLQENLKFDKTEDDVISYTLNGAAVGDKWSQIKVIFNVSKESKDFKIGAGWKVASDGEKFYEDGSKSNKIYSKGVVKVPKVSAVILFKN
ncbi:MAG: type I pullulanase [Flavobacteriales bacterium]|nr:type I pullulanase [Flavobacteriales bacterium]